MKKDILIKIAITFGDTRNILNKMKEKHIMLMRANNNRGAFFHPNSKTINVPHNSLAAPRSVLAHEYGHAAHFMKKKNISNISLTDKQQKPKRLIKRLFKPDNSNSHVRTIEKTKTLKQERIANNNALGFMKDKSSREEYKNRMVNPYKSYKLNTVASLPKRNEQQTTNFKGSLTKKPWER